MPLTPSDRLAAAPNVIFRALGDEAVIVSLDEGLYFGLDEVGTRIWMLLAAHDVAGVGRLLAREFDVSEERAVTDALAFAERLVARGLATRVATPD